MFLYFLDGCEEEICEGRKKEMEEEGYASHDGKVRMGTIRKRLRSPT